MLTLRNRPASLELGTTKEVGRGWRSKVSPLLAPAVPFFRIFGVHSYLQPEVFSPIREQNVAIALQLPRCRSV